MKRGVVIILLVAITTIILAGAIILITYRPPTEKEEPSYILHEWGVLLGNSARTSYLVSWVMAAKPIIYLYSHDNFNLSLSVDFENGNAMEVWPYIPTGKKISWNDFGISSDCITTPFPTRSDVEDKEVYYLGDYVVENANCITYKDTKSKILFYNGKIDYGNPITGYYIDSGDSKQITLTNNLEQDIFDIYINYKFPRANDSMFGFPDTPINVTLGIARADLKAGETKTFYMNVSTYNVSEELPVAWKNQGKEFKQHLINKGLYTEEASKFMTAWEDTFFSISYWWTGNMDYRDGMNMIYILPEEKYNELFKLEASIEPEEIKRVGVAYAYIQKSSPIGGASTSGSAAGEECIDYANQIKIYCNPFLSTYDKELCNNTGNSYTNNNCCRS